MPPVSADLISEEVRAQEQALRRTKKQARETVASNALIRAAGTGQRPAQLIVRLTLTTDVLQLRVHPKQRHLQHQVSDKSLSFVNVVLSR